MSDEYLSSVDYRMQLLNFVKCNKTLLCSNFEETVDQFLYLVRYHKNPNYQIYVYYSGLQFMLQTRERDRLLLLQQSCFLPDSGDWIFMTVGFDDKTDINGHIMLSFANQICDCNGEQGQKMFTKGVFSLEKHRKDKSGNSYIHHHIHFLLFLTKHIRPGKIAEKVLALSGIKKFCKKENFVDIKTPNAKKVEKRAQSYDKCFDYVNGIKTNDKAECIGADILWRQSLGLETVYSYN